MILTGQFWQKDQPLVCLGKELECDKILHRTGVFLDPLWRAQGQRIRGLLFDSPAALPVVQGDGGNEDGADGHFLDRAWPAHLLAAHGKDGDN